MHNSFIIENFPNFSIKLIIFTILTNIGSISQSDHQYKTPFFKMTRDIGSYNEYNPKFF